MFTLWRSCGNERETTFDPECTAVVGRTPPVWNGKAAGPDGIPPEAIEADLETSAEMLYNLFGKIWETYEIPDDWKEGYLIKLPKKGDLKECKNWRGIMLLSNAGKVFNRIILEKLKAEVDDSLRDEQAGFRKERSCTDNIATFEDHCGAVSRVELSCVCDLCGL